MGYPVTVLQGIERFTSSEAEIELHIWCNFQSLSKSEVAFGVQCNVKAHTRNFPL